VETVTLTKGRGKDAERVVVNAGAQAQQYLGNGWSVAEPVAEEPVAESASSKSK
jgi:hypothetical protein